MEPTASPRVSRRLVLRGILALGAAFAGLSVWRHAIRYPTPSSTYQVLRPMHVVVLQAVGRVLYPGGHGMPTAHEAGFVQAFDDLLTRMPAVQRREVLAMVTVFEHGTTPFGMRSRRFSRLSHQGQEVYLRSWEQSRVYTRRAVSEALIVTSGMAYYGAPQVAEAMRYHARCPSDVDAPEPQGSQAGGQGGAL